MAATVVRVDIERPIERWRPLVQWFLCLPHLLWNGVLTGLSGPVALVCGLVALAGRPIPPKLLAFQALVLRERVRAYSQLFLLRRSFPPFATAVTSVDPGDDPVVTVSYDPPATAERAALLRSLRVLHHVIVLLPVGAAMDLLYPLWALVAAVNGGWPPAFERLIVRVERWVLAIVAYVTLLTDERPTFGLAAYD